MKYTGGTSRIMSAIQLTPAHSDGSQFTSTLPIWLGQQLEQLGVDAAIYTRYILSLLHQDPFEIEEEETIQKSCKPVFSGYDLLRRNDKKQLTCRSEQDLKKSAVLDCLLSVSDERHGLEELVDELYLRLQEEKNDETLVLNNSEESYKVANPIERYDQAFPALSDCKNNNKICSIKTPWCAIASLNYRSSEKLASKELDNLQSFSRSFDDSVALLTKLDNRWVNKVIEDRNNLRSLPNLSNEQFKSSLSNQAEKQLAENDLLQICLPSPKRVCSNKEVIPEKKTTPSKLITSLDIIPLNKTIHQLTKKLFKKTETSNVDSSLCFEDDSWYTKPLNQLPILLNESSSRLYCRSSKSFNNQSPEKSSIKDLEKENLLEKDLILSPEQKSNELKTERFDNTEKHANRTSRKDSLLFFDNTNHTDSFFHGNVFFDDRPNYFCNLDELNTLGNKNIEICQTNTYNNFYSSSKKMSCASKSFSMQNDVNSEDGDSKNSFPPIFSDFDTLFELPIGPTNDPAKVMAFNDKTNIWNDQDKSISESPNCDQSSTDNIKQYLSNMKFDSKQSLSCFQSDLLSTDDLNKNVLLSTDYLNKNVDSVYKSDQTPGNEGGNSNSMNSLDIVTTELQPSEGSAFRDKIPPRHPHLSHVVSDSCLDYSKCCASNTSAKKVEVRSLFKSEASVLHQLGLVTDPTPQVQTQEILFSPDRHFKPIVSQQASEKSDDFSVEEQIKSYTKNINFFDELIDDQSKNYQVYEQDQYQQSEVFVPRFRLRNGSEYEKSQQTSIDGCTSKSVEDSAAMENILCGVHDILMSDDESLVDSFEKYRPVTNVCETSVDLTDHIKLDNIDVSHLWNSSPINDPSNRYLSNKNSIYENRIWNFCESSPKLFLQDDKINLIPEPAKKLDFLKHQSQILDTNFNCDFSKQPNLETNWSSANDELYHSDTNEFLPEWTNEEFTGTNYMSYFSDLSPLDDIVFSNQLEESWINSKYNKESLSSPKPHVKSCSSQRPCSYFLEGECRRADCRFSHDVSNVTCRFWKESECFKGFICPFLHGYPSENVNSKNSTDLLNKIDPSFKMELEDFPALSDSELKKQQSKKVNIKSKMKKMHGCEKKKSTFKSPRIHSSELLQKALTSSDRSKNVSFTWRSNSKHKKKSIKK